MSKLGFRVSIRLHRANLRKFSDLTLDLLMLSRSISKTCADGCAIGRAGRKNHWGREKLTRNELHCSRSKLRPTWAGISQPKSYSTTGMVREWMTRGRAWRATGASESTPEEAVVTS